MPTLATVRARIADALAPKPNEMADWVTHDEAKAILDEARAANDPAADAEVAALSERSMPRSIRVDEWHFHRHNPMHTSSWKTQRIDRLNQPAPPAGKVWIDDSYGGAIPTHLHPDSTKGMIHAYLLEKNVAASNRYIGSFHFGTDRQRIANSTYDLAPGHSLLFDLPSSDYRGSGKIYVSPRDVLQADGGALTTGYVPGSRLPIRRGSIMVPPGTPSGEFTVTMAGLTFKIRVP